MALLETQKVVATIENRFERYLKWARQLEKESSRKTIHHFRIASRNLLAIAPLMKGSNSWRKPIKDQLNSLGALRDLQMLEKRFAEHDVVCEQLRSSISHELHQWQKSHRHLLNKGLYEELNHSRKKTIKSIEQAPQDFNRDVRRLYHDIRDKLLGRFEHADPTRPRTLHKLRIAFKAFRYFSVFYHEIGILKHLDKKGIERWQMLLGSIQDDEVASKWLSENLPDDVMLARRVKYNSKCLREQYSKDSRYFRVVVFGTMPSMSHPTVQYSTTPLSKDNPLGFHRILFEKRSMFSIVFIGITGVFFVCLSLYGLWVGEIPVPRSVTRAFRDSSPGTYYFTVFIYALLGLLFSLRSGFGLFRKCERRKRFASIKKERERSNNLIHNAR